MISAIALNRYPMPYKAPTRNNYQPVRVGFGSEDSGDEGVSPATTEEPEHIGKGNCIGIASAMAGFAALIFAGIGNFYFEYGTGKEVPTQEIHQLINRICAKDSARIAINNKGKKITCASDPADKMKADVFDRADMSSITDKEVMRNPYKNEEFIDIDFDTGYASGIIRDAKTGKNTLIRGTLKK